MKEFKVGKRVVVTASNEELRGYLCNGKIKNGGSHKITGTKGMNNECHLDSMTCGWVRHDMIKLATPKWSIYTNDIQWRDLSNKQKGKMLLAGHGAMEFTINGDAPIKFPSFNNKFAVYKAVKGSK